MNKSRLKIADSQSAFTLVELLIATTIFSVILLITTYGMLSIGRIYYKGVNSSTVQSVSRSISDEIVQGIQFSGGDILPATENASGFGKFCIADKKFSYALDKQVSDTFKHAFIVENDPSCSPVSSIDASGNVDPAVTSYRDLISAPMRLSDIKVELEGGVGPGYVVKIRIVSGDDDLLEDKSGKITTEAGYDFRTAKCRGTAGSQFCAASELYTIANKRI